MTNTVKQKLHPRHCNTLDKKPEPRVVTGNLHLVGGVKSVSSSNDIRNGYESKETESTGHNKLFHLGLNKKYTTSVSA